MSGEGFIDGRLPSIVFLTREEHSAYHAGRGLPDHVLIEMDAIRAEQEAVPLRTAGDLDWPAVCPHCRERHLGHDWCQGRFRGGSSAS